MGDKPTQGKFAEKWAKAYDDLQVRLDEMDKHSLSEEDKALAQAMRAELATYVGGYNDMKERIENGELRTPQASNHYISKYNDAIQQMEDTSEAFATENIERMHGKDAYVAGVKRKTLALLGIFLVAAVALSLVITGVLSRSIVRPLGMAMEVSNRVAAGELDHEVVVDRNDEIGKLLKSNKAMVDSLRAMAKLAEDVAAGDLTVNIKPQSDRDVLGNAFATMNSKLRQIIAEVRESANVVASGSSQVNASAQRALQRHQRAGGVRGGNNFQLGRDERLDYSERREQPPDRADGPQGHQGCRGKRPGCERNRRGHEGLISLL